MRRPARTGTTVAVAALFAVRPRSPQGAVATPTRRPRRGDTTTTTIAAAPTSTTAATTTTVPPAGISNDAIRDAKVGWAQFVADNFATPDAILDPCPLLTVDAANAGVSALGLVPSDLPFGVSLYRDATGVGIIGIACGADLADAASPPGATLFAVEVTLLDGQAVFPQYVVRVGGQDTPIERPPPNWAARASAGAATMLNSAWRRGTPTGSSSPSSSMARVPRRARRRCASSS